MQNLPNPTYQTKPNPHNQTYQTKSTKPNLPNQTYWSKQSTPGSVVPLAMFISVLCFPLVGLLDWPRLLFGAPPCDKKIHYGIENVIHMCTTTESSV